MATDDSYLTVEEFAALPSDVHHAVWQAVHEHRIDTIAVSHATSTINRYRRDQVAEIVRGLEAGRG